jgi:hypothetical protein
MEKDRKDASEYAKDASKDASEYAKDASKDASEYAKNASKDASEYAKDASKDASEYAKNASKDASEYAKNASKDAKVLSKDDFHFYKKNLFILWDGKTNFSCKCPKGMLYAPFWLKHNAANHSKMSHGYTLDGDWIGTKNETPVTAKSTPVEPDQENNEKIKKELEKLEQPNLDDIIFSKVNDGIQASVISSYVNDLKDLAKDAEIMYIFQKLKSENKIPKNITLSAFIKELFGFYCIKFGHNFMYYQDTSKMGAFEMEIQKDILKENMT